MPCRRCSQRSIECLYKPVRDKRPQREAQIMHAHIEELRNQVQSLKAQIDEMKDQSCAAANQILPWLSPMAPPNSASKLPLTFTGPTTPEYCIKDIKSCLKEMGLTTEAEEGYHYNIDTSPSSKSAIPSLLDPLWLIEEEEALRLLRVYEEECHIAYPVFDMNTLRNYLRAVYLLPQRRNDPFANSQSLHGYPAEYEQTTLLRLVLACAMKVDSRKHCHLSDVLFSSVRVFERLLAPTSNLEMIALLVVAATFQFWSGRESDAWQCIGFAARMSFKIGLHQNDTLVSSYEDGERQWALRIFWVVYTLDRRFSFGTGLPFAIQDSDIDSNLPMPNGEYPYLLYITDYSRAAAKIWVHVTGLQSGNPPRQNTAEYLDYLILRWYSQLPSYLSFNGQDLSSGHSIVNRGLRRLRLLLRLRRNEARILIHRALLNTSARTFNYEEHGKIVVAVSKDTIETVTAINDVSNLYRSQEVCYNYFLKQSIAAILLAAVRSPVLFDNEIHQTVCRGLQLLESSGIFSSGSLGVYKTARDLRSLESNISFVFLGINADRQVALGFDQSFPCRSQSANASAPQSPAISHDAPSAFNYGGVAPLEGDSCDGQVEKPLPGSSGPVLDPRQHDRTKSYQHFFDSLINFPVLADDAGSGQPSDRMYGNPP